MMNKNMLKQAQQMQARLAAVQDEIAVARTEATAGGGVVKVSVIGGAKVEAIQIDPDHGLDHRPPHVASRCARCISK